MSFTTLSADSEMQARRLLRCRVERLSEGGIVRVASEDDDEEPFACLLLQTSEGPGLRLTPGDPVLALRPEAGTPYGVILGRIGPASDPIPPAQPKPEDTPDELVLEAKHNLTLRCGDGSITLRSDGKVLISGKDLVSRARNMIRIKGGAVAIN